MDILAAVAAVVKFIVGTLFALSLNQIIIIVLALLFIKKLRSTNRYKGWIGEQKVRALLWLWLSKKEYHLFYDVTLPAGEGTTQIDHIVVSKYGVFVIECKNIRGWLFGQEREEKWTLKLPRKNLSIPNPLRQNYGHVQTLRALLNCPEGTVKSIVAFPESAAFKTKMPPNVLKYRDICNHIKSHGAPVLSDSAVAECLEKIGAERLKPGLLTNMRHKRHIQRIRDCNNATARSTIPPSIQHVREVPAPPAAASTPRAPDRHTARNRQPQKADAHSVTAPARNDAHSSEDAPHTGKQVECPKCRGKMVLRIAKSGTHAGKQFWGCSTYPQCRGTKSIEEISPAQAESGSNA